MRCTEFPVDLYIKEAMGDYANPDAGKKRYRSREEEESAVNEVSFL